MGEELGNWLFKIGKKPNFSKFFRPFSDAKSHNVGEFWVE
jgi:hypothetical protein